VPLPQRSISALERFQAKWKPVRVKKTRQIKNLEPRFDSIETEKALGSELLDGAADAPSSFDARVAAATS
jgi:hypothetical protein